MKTIFSFGLITTALMYLFFSFGNHSWDPMTWNVSSTYWFGCLSSLGWIVGLLVVALDMDKEYDDEFFKR